MLDGQNRAVQRESQLAAELIGHGITMLGRANHAQTGSYALAFFGLSAGMERMGKLIFLADHAIQNAGAFPKKNDFEHFGHKIKKLLAKCESISSGMDLSQNYMQRPNRPIHQDIVKVLDLYATGRRYHNLNYIGGEKDKLDPIGMWWEKVGKPICELHYPKKQREKDLREAAILENVLGCNTKVIHSAESGEAIGDVQTFYARGGGTEVVQRWGRLYTLQIVRWLAAIIYQLSHLGADKKGIDPLFGMHEPFENFLMDDGYLRRRKRWSNY